jgi:hypothetical protein
MSEWWTYRLSDFLMFSPRTYYRMFELYNRAVWPAQLVALVFGVTLVACVARPTALRSRAAATILAGAWLWVAFAFHLRRFAAIHTGAKYLAAAGVVEVLLLLGFVVQPGSPGSSRRLGRNDLVGLAIALFAVGVQPLIGPLLGRDWHQVELFGLAPDPTALATLGVLLVLRRPWSWLAWVVPILWCLFSGATLWTLGASDFWILPFGGVLAIATGLFARPGAARPELPER